MFKRIGAILVTISMLFSMALTFSVATAADAMALEVVVRDDAAKVNPGDKVTVDVYVANQSAALSLVTVFGKFDAAKWDIQESDITSALPSSMQFNALLLKDDADANIRNFWIAETDILPEADENGKYKFFTVTFTAKEVTENPGSAFSFWFKEEGVYTSSGVYTNYSAATASATVMVEKPVPTISAAAATVNQGESVDVTIGVDQYYGNMLTGVAFTGTFDAAKFDAEVTNLPAGVAAAPVIGDGTFEVTFSSAAAIAAPGFTLKLTAKADAELGASDVVVAFKAAGMIGNGFTATLGTHYSTAPSSTSVEILETVVVKDYVAQIGEVQYETVAEALAAAKSGETVTLLKDCEDTGLATVVNPGVIFDLNGKYLTSKNFLSFGSVIDTAAEVGGIKISNDMTKSFVDLQSENVYESKPYMPIYDSTVGCYRFFAYSMNARPMLNSGAIRFNYGIVFENWSAYQLLADSNNSCELKFKILLNMSNADGVNKDIDFTFEMKDINDFAAACIKNNRVTAYYLSVAGFSKLTADTTFKAKHYFESSTRTSHILNDNSEFVYTVA